MARVLFGTTASPFLLAATLKYHFKKFELEYPRVCSLLNTQLYVDDFISGAEDELQAFDIYREVKHILSDGGFNMRKWRSNCKDLQVQFNEAEGTDDSPNEKGKVLGYVWNSDNDNLEIHLHNQKDDRRYDNVKTTKRKLVREASKIFDPCGFISPFTIRPKILLQDVWKERIKWDDEIPSEIEEKFKKWHSEMDELIVIKVPRFYFIGTKCSIIDAEVHCFVDASIKAYGAVLYLRYEDLHNKMHTSFLCSRSRVAPLKKLTLSRLELMSALIGTRIVEYALKNMTMFSNYEVYYWTDSMIVLHWIRGCSRKLKTFVQNRVAEIRKKSNADSWAHCPGKENPADFITRGLTLEQTRDNEVWAEGLRWLKENQSKWPNQKIIYPPDESEIEISNVTNLLMTTETETLFDIRKYSTLSKLLRVTAFIRRFIYNLKKPQEKKTDVLTTEEIEAAEKYWIKKIQDQTFSEEKHPLLNKSPLPNKSSIRSMNPFEDRDGIIRVGGRLQNSDLEYTEAHPIILPGDSPFCRTIKK